MLLSLALSAFALDEATLPGMEVPAPTEEVTAGGGGTSGGGKAKSGGGKKKKGSTGGSRSGGGSSSGADADKEEDTGDIKLFKKHKLGKWKYQGYVMPGAGVKIDTGSSEDDSGDSSVGGAFGADVGIKLWRKKWRGNLGIGGDYSMSSAYKGYEVRGGGTIGNRQKYWGADVGLELFYNAYTFTDVPGSTAAATANDIEGAPGVSIPLLVTLGPKDLYGVLGVKPSFPIGSDRGTTGQNIAYVAGIGADLGGLSGQLYYVRQTINGVVFNSVEATVPF